MEFSLHDIGRVQIDELQLDPLNPRLPAGAQNGSQAELLEHLFENDVLDELAASFIANGYFDNEPILVLPPNENGKRIAVEGNRRLSTLIILTQGAAAIEAGLEFDLSTPPTDQQVREFSSIPAFEVQSRSELSAYLGYRHIGGIREWPPESKARWIHRSVTDAAAEGATNPFYEVGRAIGSNSRGIRTAYLTLELLRLARDEYDISTEYVENQRFSVWGLVIANSRVREHIGLPTNMRELNEVQQALRNVDFKKVDCLIQDLTPSEGRLAVVSDSRMVSKYAEVLSNEKAHDVLRQYSDLELASSVLEQGALTDRLRFYARALKQLLGDVGQMEIDSEAKGSAEELANHARSILAVVRDRSEDDN